MTTTNTGRPGDALLRAWIVTAVVDGLFSSALSVLAYHSTVAQLWQRVASTLVGPSALQGGMAGVALGLLMHAGVALGWSVVFLAMVMMWPRLRALISTPAGVVGVAAVYGPLVWMVMSLLVIPTLTGKPPAITGRWWVQLLGHIPFVAVPIVGMIARGLAAPVHRDDAFAIATPRA